MGLVISWRGVWALFLVLSGFCVSMGQAVAATEECSFENAVDIQTVFFVANADANMGGKTAAAVQSAQEELNKVRASVPESCSDEMVASSSNPKLADLCAPANRVALPAMIQAIGLVTANYVVTGNRQAYVADVHATMGRYLSSIPRPCWFAPMDVQQINTGSSRNRVGDFEGF
jgi:hypothetical protein